VAYATTNWEYLLGFVCYDRLNSDYESGGFTGMLAEEATLDASAMTGTLRLRSGLEFHNAKTITADDLIYTFQRVLNRQRPGVAAPLLNLDLTSLSKVDQRTVKFSLTSPNSFFLSHLAAAQAGIVPVGFDPQNPVGSGPFKLSNLTPGQSVTLSRFGNYWNTPPYVGEVQIQNYSPASIANAFASKEVDIAAAFSLSQVSQMAADGVRMVIHDTGQFYPYAMRSDTGPFADVRARQALRLAVDRRSLIQQLLDGYGSVASDLFSPTDSAFDSPVLQRETDIGQAKALLKAAGVTGLTVNMATSPYLPNAEVALAQQLKQVGISVNVQAVDPTTYYAKHYAQDPLFVSDWLNQPLARINALCYGPQAPFPETGWHNPSYLSLWAAAKKETDPAKRRDIEIQMQQIYHQEGPWVIWGFPKEVDAVATNIGGAANDSSGFPFSRFLALKNMWIA
jgi:peptide/nickel transport system substrate-binding protein